MDDRRIAIGRIGRALADLVTRAPTGALTTKATAQVADLPWPRPPGALREPEFLDRCTRCGDCVQACAYGAVGTLPASSGVLANTPAMLPAEVACHLCPDTPCITACEPGALVPTPVEEILLGMALIQTDRCFAFKGPECGACASACPPRAMVLDGTRPRVRGDLCTGCGLCVEACPVWGKAIEIVH